MGPPETVFFIQLTKIPNDYKMNWLTITITTSKSFQITTL